MSSNEVLSRQVNLAIEIQKQQEEMLKERATLIPEVESSKRTSSISNMDTARLKILAMRRTTLRSQENDFDLHVVLHEKMKEVHDSLNELEEDLEDTSSINTVVDGYIVK